MCAQSIDGSPKKALTRIENATTEPTRVSCNLWLQLLGCCTRTFCVLAGLCPPTTQRIAALARSAFLHGDGLARRDGRVTYSELCEWMRKSSGAAFVVRCMDRSGLLQTTAVRQLHSAQQLDWRTCAELDEAVQQAAAVERNKVERTPLFLYRVYEQEVRLLQEQSYHERYVHASPTRLSINRCCRAAVNGVCGA